MEDTKTIINLECEVCKKVTKHNYDRSVRNGTVTTITVCKECGKVNVDVDPDDSEMKVIN